MLGFFSRRFDNYLCFILLDFEIFTLVPVQVPFPKFVHAAGDEADAEVKLVEENGEDGAKAAGIDDSEPRADKATKPNRWKRNNLAKQSGVPNVLWDPALWAWKVLFPTFDKKGKRTGRTSRNFSLNKFMQQGLSEEQADAAALEAAKAFRSDLVKQGILKEPKPVDLNFTSEVIGVSWNKQKKRWIVRLQPTGKKTIGGGNFTEKAAAEAKALELAKEHGLERKVKAVSHFSERFAGLPIFKPKVPYPGVNWSQSRQQWHAQCKVNGAHLHFRVRPKDHSEAELEASFQKAVAWKKKHEKEKRISKANGPQLHQWGKLPISKPKVDAKIAAAACTIVNQ